MYQVITNPGAGIKKVTIRTEQGQDGQAGVFIELENGLVIDVDTGHFQALHWGVGAPDQNYMTFARMRVCDIQDGDGPT